MTIQAGAISLTGIEGSEPRFLNSDLVSKWNCVFIRGVMRSRSSWAIFTICVMFVVSAGCTREPDDNTKLRIAALELKISDIEKSESRQREFLLSQINELEQRLSKEQQQVFDLRHEKVSVSEPAIILADAKGFSLIRHELTTLAVRITNVRPHLDGQEVTLVITNLTSAILDRPKLNIQFGERMPVIPQRGTELNDAAWNAVKAAFLTESERVLAGRKSLREVDFNCPQAGSSALVKVIIAPATPREGVWFSIGVDCDRLQFPPPTM